MIIECKKKHRTRISQREFYSKPWINCRKCGLKMKKKSKGIEK